MVVEKLNLWDEEKQFEVAEKLWDIEKEDNIFTRSMLKKAINWEIDELLAVWFH